MDFKEVGHTIQIAGVIYNSDKEEETYLLMLPDKELHNEMLWEDFTLEQWTEFFMQTDVLNIELNDIQKTIVRKAERQIAGGVSWKVYHRDNYSCRYCGKSGIPLTVDHIILWEDGGPSIEENLLTSCRKCNRTRGNTPYEEWINSKKYTKVAENISTSIFTDNLRIVRTLDKIPRSFTKMRGKKR
jgi:hypothetical protein